MRVAFDRGLKPSVVALILCAIIVSKWKPDSLRSVFEHVDYSTASHAGLPSERHLDSTDRGQPSRRLAATPVAGSVDWSHPTAATTTQIDKTIPEPAGKIAKTGNDVSDSPALAVTNAGRTQRTEVTQPATRQIELGFNSSLNARMISPKPSENVEYDVLFGGPPLNPHSPAIGFGFRVGNVPPIVMSGDDPSYVEPTFPTTSPGQESPDPTSAVTRDTYHRIVDDAPPKEPDNPTPVPEPATLMLTGIGLGGLVARHVRRKRAARA